MARPLLPCLLLPALVGPLGAAPASEQEAASGEDDQAATQGEFDEQIDVIGLAPLDHAGESPDRVPWTVHRVAPKALDLSAVSGVGVLLEAELPGVSLAPAQGSALQSDVLYRGFGASPLLGANQGLSVYEDGVRVNEVFGDVVAWDLVPTFAAEQVELLPGANPMFGLNTLGGALALNTHSGFDSERLDLTLEAGSFGRRAGEFGAGGAFGPDDEYGWFVGGRSFEEDGWRDFSPSSLRQALVKLSHRGERERIDFAVGVADNDLIGNGVTPVELLEIDRAEVFTHPDQTWNELFFPRLRLGRMIGPELELEAQVYLRGNDVDTYNADAFEGDDDDDDDHGHDDDHDHDDHEGDDDHDDEFDAVNNQSRTEQEGLGASIQISGLTGSGRWLAGASWDGGRADFAFETELASLTGTRTTIGSGMLLPGSEVGLRADTGHAGLWALRHWTTAGDRLTWTLQARYNDSRIELNDRLGTALDGDHSFSRLVPSAGFVRELRGNGSSSMLLFGNVSQSSRVPTPVELTCADPDDPCRLPNAFVADPPLDQVVTTSAEFGLRGGGPSLRWSAALFHSESRDDIIFVSSGAGTSAGYFTNVDATRRQGLELWLRGSHDRLNWDASYTLLDATFQDRLTLSSPPHPLAEDGEIEVEPGDFLPGVPRRQFRAGADLTLGGRVVLGARLLGDSTRYLRGDEANLLEPVGSAWRGDLWSRIELTPSLDLDLEVSNVTDREYETFGALGEPDEVLGDDYEDPRFLSPAEPRAFRASLRFRL
ncbi:MAG: TonB-dependent receptor [Acidobacteria bacterium]|nr:TonB-dependent receptor [Acidobacteriota bacterium]